MRVYKVCSTTEWLEAQSQGVFRGSGIDLSDGYIHLSTASQLAETLRLHFKGRGDLTLFELDAQRLELTWEPSRGGALFPHLYGELDLSACTCIWTLALGTDETPQLPPALVTATQ